MPKSVLVSISPGTDADLFTVSDDIGNTIATNVTRASLEAGVVYVVDSLALSISVTSTYLCTNTEIGVIAIPPSPSVTPTPTTSVGVSLTPTVTPSITVTTTPSITVSNTPTVTPSITVSNTPTVTPTVTPSTSPYGFVTTLLGGTYGTSNSNGTITNINPTQVYLYLVVTSGGNSSGNITLDSLTLGATQVFPVPTSITATGQTIYSTNYGMLAPGATDNWSLIKNDGLTLGATVKMGWALSPGGPITIINV